MAGFRPVASAPVAAGPVAAAAAITGTLAATEAGADTFAGAGGALVSGAMAAVETGSDTFAGAGSGAIAGTLAAVETGEDTFAGSGGSALIVIDRGDAAPPRSWKQDFYDRQIDEVDRLLKRLNRKKARKKPAVIAAEAFELIKDMPPVIVADARQRLSQAILERNQSRMGVAAVLQGLAERAQAAKQAKIRRKRQEEEFVLRFLL